jgi:hypothetical protein
LPLELTADSDAADSSRGDSLAEDLERLMASAAKPPLLTPAEHEVALAAPSAPLDEPEPVFGVTEPLAPTPSLGVALSSATPPLVEPPVPREAVPGVATNEAPADFDATPSADPDAAAQLASADTTPVSSLSVSEVLPVPSAQPQMSPPPSGHEPTAHPIEMLPIDGVPTYEMVAPVELSFTVGDGRVGVKAGTRTYGEFQRLASILLGDLRKARGW